MDSSVELAYEVQILQPLPGYREIENQGFLVFDQDPELLPTDDPDRPGSEDPTLTPDLRLQLRP